MPQKLPEKPRRVAFMLDLEWPHKRHAGIFAGAQRYAFKEGWQSIIDEYAAETLARSRHVPSPYDGVIGRVNGKLAREAARLGVPVVNVWYSSPVQKRLPGVFPDFVASGQLRAEHLLGRGLRQFAALAREDRGDKLAAAAFHDVVREAGFDCVNEKLPLHPTRTYATWCKSERLINDWMDKWRLPIGVDVVTEQAGRMVVQLCKQRGWRVPEDVAIIAGRNEETLCENPRPSLSSMEFDYERIGYEAARMLDGLMNQRNRKKIKDTSPKHLLLPPKGLVVRESTDFFAVEDELVAAALLFISANCHRRIEQRHVATAVNMELRTLQRRFRITLDRGIATEIRRVRLERAKRELTQSQRPISEIARAVGFGQSKQMDAVFHRELGITPSQYRKQREVGDSPPPV